MSQHKRRVWSQESSISLLLCSSNLKSLEDKLIIFSAKWEFGYKTLSHSLRTPGSSTFTRLVNFHWGIWGGIPPPQIIGEKIRARREGGSENRDPGCTCCCMKSSWWLWPLKNTDPLTIFVTGRNTWEMLSAQWKRTFRVILHLRHPLSGCWRGQGLSSTQPGQWLVTLRLVSKSIVWVTGQ